MSNKKPVGSFIGAVIFGVITTFFVFLAVKPQGEGDALLPLFAFLFGSVSGTVFLVFLLIWAVRKSKHGKEQSYRNLMARPKVDRWRREQKRRNDL